MLLGADLYPILIRSESIARHIVGFSSAMDNHLGWIIIGLVNPLGGASAPCISLLLTFTLSIDTLLHRFWSFEEPVALAMSCVRGGLPNPHHEVQIGVFVLLCRFDTTFSLITIVFE